MADTHPLIRVGDTVEYIYTGDRGVVETVYAYNDCFFATVKFQSGVESTLLAELRRVEPSAELFPPEPENNYGSD